MAFALIKKQNALKIPCKDTGISSYFMLVYLIAIGPDPLNFLP